MGLNTTLITTLQESLCKSSNFTNFPGLHETMPVDKLHRPPKMHVLIDPGTTNYV